MSEETEGKTSHSDSLGSLVGEVMDIDEISPPNDDNFYCVIVFDDGYESKSDGKSVCRSSISTKWRHINVGYLSDDYRNMTFNDGEWTLPNVQK